MFGVSPPANRLADFRNEEDIPAAITDVGCERTINEDRYAVIDSPVGRAWIVCDGMGGAMGGELAAQLAIDAARRGLEAREYTTTAEALKSAIEEANRVIVLRRQNPAFSSMGTTIVGALVFQGEVVVAHAGDSRAYLVRDGAVQQLTVDHTYVQDLVDRGALNQEDALSHPQAHVLTRCLGAEPNLKLDLQHYWIWDVENNEPEDKLLLCSDGLYSLISDEELAEKVSTMTPQECCVELVELAKERGGYDNITLAIMPLGGQMREESPQGEKLPRRRAAAAPMPAVQAQAPALSPAMQLSIMFLLALLGGVVVMIWALLRFQ